MAKAAKVNLDIPQGRTFSHVLQWCQERFAYRQIASASQAAPCILVTTEPHELPDNWPFSVSNAKGMAELNSPADAECNPERNYDAVVIDETTIEINSLNAAGFKPYSSGGIITYNLPQDLAGFTAAAQVRAKIDSEIVLLSMTTENAGIILDNTAKTITLQASAVATASIDWMEGVWDLELTSPSGRVYPVAAGSVKVIREVTRP
ncbi:MAG: hypothetical protein V4607_02180 [Pseudomonadota bacterium]